MVTTKANIQDQGIFEKHIGNDKKFKICSVLDGLDVTRIISWSTRRFFEGAIEDVEAIREFVSEAARNKDTLGTLSSMEDLIYTLDWKGRGLKEGMTTLQAGLGYVDDREDRRIERYVGFENEPYVGDKESDYAFVNIVSNIFPWIVDRRSKENYWWKDHHNGRNQGSMFAPLLFDFLYSAAWIGTYGEAWAYYPPMSVFSDGHPFTFTDLIGTNYSTHKALFVAPNLPENDPDRRAHFTAPYPDTARPGKSLITVSAPIYFTGIFHNYTYNDTYIACTGLDIAVSSVSSLLSVLFDSLTKESFAILVDSKFNIIVISQPVVEMIYPKRTGFEKDRVTYSKADGSIIEDRRNVTYRPSDTMFESLTKLKNADWSALLSTILEIRPGERDFSTLDLIITGNQHATEFYVMFERWQYVADWVLLAFAPTHEVENAINVEIYSNISSKNMSSLFLEGEKGHVLTSNIFLVNSGNLDVLFHAKAVPHWLHLNTNETEEKTLHHGNNMLIEVSVLTSELEFGTSSFSITFGIRDDYYPNCFYNKDIRFDISVRVLRKDCVTLTGDKLRTQALDGNCVCVTDALEIRSKCYSYFTLFSLALIPLAIFVLCSITWYIERKREQSESVWTVKTSELQYDDPPKVLGRGTFGLVVLAEYRGTKVAIKRVIPPKLNLNGDNNSFEDLEFKATDPKTTNMFDFTESTAIINSSNLPKGRGLMSSLVVDYGSMGKNRSGWTRWHKRNTYDELVSDLILEVRQISKLRHPCITTMMGASFSKDEPLLVMEYMDYGSLFDLLHNTTIIVEGDNLLPILRDVAQGIRFLHSAIPLVIHGDLKAQNILVDKHFRAKVSDFGLSQKKQTRGGVGTPYWMAPELLRGESCNTAASDVYSFGIILYEVYSRKIPYEGETFEKVIKLIQDPTMNKRPSVPSAMPLDVASLMADCLIENPEARPTSHELDARLKRFGVKNVEPDGKISSSLQEKKVQTTVKNLLYDIFPCHIADALSNGHKIEPENHECVAIFFSDIVDYTNISGSMPPFKVSDMLDRLYTKFDALSHEHDIFKVETIGDSWVGVTNLVNVQTDFAKRIALFSFDVVKAANNTLIDVDTPSKGFIQIRVGFHSGPVLTNVVGSRNPRFCLIGDTVNVASRMESNSLPGRIHCSQIVAEQLAMQDPGIAVIYRGCIGIKGKGDMHTYWVEEFDNWQLLH
eukprot:CAMPEP_0194365924 /NCGR_PEP_ID=MMETSP0174-20130528/13911_1 /TAXON_ID=216777 /ORGANISM="Proboscia alata, Strain PI-D3" /LENGTH=1196 /DNA_ID=CAMNT_0039140815 /DNA_START=168 /DNA_END=3758 /DNA_ORIENTATION=-